MTETPDMDITSSNTVTLVDFIRREQRRVGSAQGFFTDILLMIALGTKVVSRGVNRAGLASLIGLAGSRNIQGEEVQKLDEYADEVFSKLLGRSGQFLSMVSEERECLFQADAGDEGSDYVIAFDPLDGSSNIDVNVSIGTIFGIYRRVSKGGNADVNDLRDFSQPGHKQVAAGYCLYGSSTMFVFSTGNGVNGFTLDPNLGEFILTNPAMKMPGSGNIYSCNEANVDSWGSGVKSYLDKLKDPAGETKYTQRYVGSLVADFHRTLLKGGVFFYPADKKNSRGKLRLLYECAPLAFLAEQAGGAATDGETRILDLVPSSIHERTPLFIGSKEMVDTATEIVSS